MSGRFQLGSEMTIYQAAALKPELLAAVTGAGDSLALDLSAVQEIDSAGVQLLLLLAQKTARELNVRLALADPTPAVRDTLTLMGLADSLA